MYRRHSELLEFVRSQRSQTNLLVAEREAITNRENAVSNVAMASSRPISHLKNADRL